MKALQYNPTSKSFDLVDAPEPLIENDDDVIVKVVYSGLCGTDIHIVQGEFTSLPSTPMTLGHEFAGEVVKTGPKAAHLKPGTRVCINPNNYCHVCDFCLAAMPNHCVNGGIRNTIGIMRPGGMADFAKVPLEAICILPQNISLFQGALCEPLSCILNGWQRLQKMGPIRPESKILIVGSGIIGNLWASLLHHSGFRSVVVSEPMETRRNITKSLGLGFEVVTPDNLEGVIGSENAAENGMDIIIDCSGSPKALESVIPFTRRGATICVFGCAPIGAPMRICPEEIYSKELTLFGCMINPYCANRAVALASNMGDRYLDGEKLGVELFDLDEYKKGLEKLKSGKISKVMFKF